MGPVWKTMLPLALVIVLVGFIAGALVTAGATDPPRRAPVEMVTAPSSATTGTPTKGPASSSVTVISPRPGVSGDDDGPDDDGPAGDDGDDDGDDERDDD